MNGCLPSLKWSQLKYPVEVVCADQMVSGHILPDSAAEGAQSSVWLVCQSCDSNHEAASDPARSLSGFSSFTSQTIFGIVVSDTLIVMGRGGCQWSAWISILLLSASRARALWCNRSLSDEWPAVNTSRALSVNEKGAHSGSAPLMDSWSSAHVRWPGVWGFNTVFTLRLPRLAVWHHRELKVTLQWLICCNCQKYLTGDDCSRPSNPCFILSIMALPKQKDTTSRWCDAFIKY